MGSEMCIRDSHDSGKSGWPDSTLMRLVDKLSAIGQVHISSERPLPKSLEAKRYSGAKTEVHHLIAKCKLYVGESLTMAQEAFLLGTPAIYDGHDVPSPTQDMVDQGLLIMPASQSEASLFLAVENSLENHEVFNQRRKEYMRTYPNLTEYILAAIGQHAKK